MQGGGRVQKRTAGEGRPAPAGRFPPTRFPAPNPPAASPRSRPPPLTASPAAAGPSGRRGRRAQRPRQPGGAQPVAPATRAGRSGAGRGGAAAGGSRGSPGRWRWGRWGRVRGRRRSRGARTRVLYFFGYYFGLFSRSPAVPAASRAAHAVELPHIVPPLPGCFGTDRRFSQVPFLQVGRSAAVPTASSRRRPPLPSCGLIPHPPIRV